MANRWQSGFLRDDPTGALVVSGSTGGGSAGFSGAWAASTAYTADEIVSYGGGLYAALADFTSGSTFDPANWRSLAGGLVAPPQARVSHRAIVLGDSISIVTIPPGGTLLTGTDVTNGQGWFSDICARSLGGLKWIGNAGVSGEQSTQILARVDTDVIALDPDICFVLVGNNDPVLGLSYATSKANYLAITGKLLAAGIYPIICTITPRAAAIWHAAHGRRNQFWRKIANDYGLPLVDFHSVLVDATNGQPLSGMMDDGTHPRTILGTKTMSDHAVNVLDDLGLWRTDVYTPLPQKLSEVWSGTGDVASGSATLSNVSTTAGTPMPGMPIYGTGIPVGAYIGTTGGPDPITLVDREGAAVLATSTGAGRTLAATDPQNILGDSSNPTFHGLMLTDTNSDGIADGWTLAGAGAGTVTKSLQTVTGVPGKMQKLVQGTSGTAVVTFTTVNDQGFVPGDRIAFMGRFKAVAEAGSMVYTFTLDNVSASVDPGTVTPIDQWARDIDAGWFYWEYVVPAGTRRFSVKARIESGTGELWYGQMCMLNLTANGIA